jgi:hypothetical protein
LAEGITTERLALRKIVIELSLLDVNTQSHIRFCLERGTDNLKLREEVISCPDLSDSVPRAFTCIFSFSATGLTDTFKYKAAFL